MIPYAKLFASRARDAVHLRVGGADAHRTSTSTASRASRAREGFGLREKTSQPARSSASSAASPPRANSATARPSAAADPRAERLAGREERPRPLRLELEQPPQRLVRPVELGDAVLAALGAGR